MKIEPNQVLLTAYLSIVTGLLGLIGGMLTKTSPTETTKAVPIPNGITVGGPPTEVQVVNKPADPVPTVEAK